MTGQSKRPGGNTGAMLTACPKCGARYRIARERLGPAGARLRCTRCEAVFRVRLPGAPVPAARPATAQAAPTPPSDRPVPDRARLVVVADADPERAKATAAALTGAGLETVLAHDGVEAILAIQRLLPRAAVLDAALPKMLSFQVCELMKRNESLRTIAVVLVGEPDARTRGASAAAESYGADAYLEPTEMPAAALGTLRRLGLPLTCSPSGADAAAASAPSPPPPASMPAPGPRRPSSAAPGPLGPAPVAPAPVAPPSPEQAPSGARPDSGEQSQAERLARIIVSDIVLYNEEKFAAAVQAGNVLDAMQAELEEARTLFRDRIDARVREQRDFLGQEIQRVARSRGMR